MKKKIIITITLVCMILCSFFVVGNIASNPQNHQKAIKYLDQKKANVLKLTALSTASSTAITMIPGDTATPIATKLADLTSWFLLILCTIFLEKYLLTITGYAAFKILIPIALLLVIIRIYWPKDILVKLALKLGLFGLFLFATVPASVFVSDLIEKTYQVTLDATMKDAEQTNETIKQETQTDDSKKAADDQNNKNGQTQENSEQKNQSIWNSIVNGGKELIDDTKQSAQDIVSDITSFGSKKIEELTSKAEKTLNNFIEATAVMTITSCIFPLLVVLFFFWLMKVFLGINIDVSKFTKPKTPLAKIQSTNNEE